ncbi:hypothetical protein Sjap_023101 [Stephania japonica]|uniref:Cycloartenol synthase n=1 Tax=Stephania japonica TaxID=461633 RepID=A0AAP0HTU2_9MAGN
MSYLYGRRFVGPTTPTILSLRRELYICPYEQVDWNKARNLCAKEDLYYPHPMIQDLLWGCLHKAVEPLLNKWPLFRLRQKALKTVMQHIHYEDESTQYVCIRPACKAALLLSQIPEEIVEEGIAKDGLYDAVKMILSLQNDNGGFGSYELTRSYNWLR